MSQHTIHNGHNKPAYGGRTDANYFTDFQLEYQRQVVVVAGTALSLPASASDLDQDPLTFRAQGLPNSGLPDGATLTLQGGLCDGGVRGQP